jgi:hypothetical protein
VKIHVKLTKANDSFYLLNTERTTLSTFKIWRPKKCQTCQA